MAFESSFETIALEDLHATAERMKAQGARFVQILGVNTDDGIDVYYTFMVDGAIVNYRVAGLDHETPVPSITDLFLAGFVFENETRELFGVNIRDIAIDFDGALYTLAEPEPMTYLSPEMKEAKDKARKAAAAKAAKEAKAAREAQEAEKEKSAEAEAASTSASADAALEAKLANMDPEKAAKVRAAMAAKAAREAAAAKGEN